MVQSNNSTLHELIYSIQEFKTKNWLHWTNTTYGKLF